MGLPVAYVLFCAGEDSGDALGESLVREALKLGFAVRGSGGPRMQAAGLEPIVDYEQLPVSGFGDVAPHLLRLRQMRKRLAEALADDGCIALVAIDYPGFNMELCRRAKECGKPVLYVAPPQVWAWKSSRAKKLRHARLAVLFDFERDFYMQQGCRAEILQFPFTGRISAERNGALLLLPGSRKRQALRNMPLFVAASTLWLLKHPDRRAVVFASRQTLKPPLERLVAKFAPPSVASRLSVETVPQQAGERGDCFARFSKALTAPGTASLELALSGTPEVVCDVLDPMTYFIGKNFVKTKFFALPNILSDSKTVRELYFERRAANRAASAVAVADALESCGLQDAEALASELMNRLSGGATAEKLMSEFLGQFL